MTVLAPCPIKSNEDTLWEVCQGLINGAQSANKYGAD